MTQAEFIDAMTSVVMSEFWFTNESDGRIECENALKAFLRDSGVEYGDPKYSWDYDAAVITVQAYILSYGEDA